MSSLVRRTFVESRCLKLFLFRKDFLKQTFYEDLYMEKRRLKSLLYKEKTLIFFAIAKIHSASEELPLRGRSSFQRRSIL